MPLVHYDGNSLGPLRWVWDTEEKGSDVNLAVELVNDAWLNLYDMAIVISNDSDLERAVSIAKRKQRTVGVLVRGDAEVNSLKRASTFWKKLRQNDLANALLPREIPGKSIGSRLSGPRKRVPPGCADRLGDRRQRERESREQK